MFEFRWPWLLPVACLLTATATQAGPPDPLDARAAVPAAVHESAFRHYRGHADVAPKPWKEANDTVGRIGGWRAYAREAAQAEAQRPPSGGASAPAPGADRRHRHH